MKKIQKPIGSFLPGCDLPEFSFVNAVIIDLANEIGEPEQLSIRLTPDGDPKGSIYVEPGDMIFIANWATTP